MSTKWNDEGIKRMMTLFLIGTVSHVDFTPINKKPGFDENVDFEVMSAFVHFSDPYIINNNYIFQSKNYMGNNSFWSAIENNKSYKLQVMANEYWICLKNTNPVQRTLMNIHQVVENGRHLENLITEQAAEIKNLKETVDGLQDVTNQLLGGLYCQRTQGGILSEHVETIGLRNTNGKKPENDTHTEGHWPTTRQGDKNAARIEKLEKIITNMDKFSEKQIAKNMIDEYKSLALAFENLETQMNNLELLIEQAKIIYDGEKVKLDNEFLKRFGCSLKYYKDNLMDDEQQDTKLCERKHSANYGRMRFLLKEN
jgi:hypothetical protein